MSFETAWVLPNEITSYESEELAHEVREILGAAGATVSVRGAADARTLEVRLPREDVDALAARLHARGALEDDWRSQMDPPRGDGDVYELHLDVVHDERPLLRVYSNDGHNRDAWPVLVAVAACLASKLGGVPEEDAEPPSDRIPSFIDPSKLLN